MTPSPSRSQAPALPVLAAGLIMLVLLAPGVGEGQAVRPTVGFRMSDASFPADQHAPGHVHIDINWPWGQ